MDTTIKKPPRKPRQTPVMLVIEREFVGDKTITEAMIPVIYEELRRNAEKPRTFDTAPDSA